MSADVSEAVEADTAFKIASDLHAAYEQLIYGLPTYLDAENLTDEENMIREAHITLDVTAHRLAALQEGSGALPASPSGGQWQPIETAPRDGQPVLLWPGDFTAWWDLGAQEWITSIVPLNADGTVAEDWTKPPPMMFEVSVRRYRLTPTHWMPLPEPPSMGEGK